jgi:LuxR family transcriptional regulator, maltose regulon positive regulatory protein
VLSDGWVGLGLAGLGDTVHELLTRFPAGVIAGDAELAARVAGDQLARGSLEEAERCLALATRTLESAPADRRGRAQVVLSVVRMRLARQRGDLETVAGEAQQLLVPAVTAEPGLGGDLRALALIDLGIAEAWTARFDAAYRHLDDGIALARQIAHPYLEVTGLAHLAQLESWRSFRLGAERGLQAIELATEHGWADEPVAGLAYLALGVAMVTQGRLEEAERALSQAERTVRAEVEPAAGMRLHYGRGMLEFVSGRHDAALSAFQAAERLASSLVTPHTLAPRLRSHLLQTLVRTGETRRVEQALADLDEPERGRGEIRLAAHARLIAEILNVLAGQKPGSPPAGPQHLREPLSQAEARVLRYLPTKLSAPEIADELYLSVNTVKTHMRHLYDKLGVHRRHEAVEQARALGLLAPSPRRS